MWRIGLTLVGTTDARAQRVPLVPPPPSSRWWPWVPLRESGALRIERTFVDRASILQFVLCLALLAAFAAIFGEFAGGASRPARAFGAFAAAAICFGPLWNVSAIIVRSRMSARIRDEYLRRLQCASCGFVLRGLIADAAGRTACPECGAAWMLTPVPVPVPVPDPAPAPPEGRNRPAPAASNPHAQAGDPA